MISRLKHIFPVMVMVIAMIMTACIEDGVTTSPSDQPSFSTDTLNMGLVFTEAGTPTHSFTVYNRHDKVLNISSISLREGDRGIFRLNVDGFMGKTFSNVEIRPNDSIFVFVEATLPPNGDVVPITIEDHLDFMTNGVMTSVVLRADGQDVERKRGIIVASDERWTAGRPYQIFDSLVVAEGATLTVDAGATLYFHDNAKLHINGTLKCNGMVERPINMTGDRIDNVVSDIPFDLMSGQWAGVYFGSTSRDNEISHTSIRNTVAGVVVDSIVDTSTPAVKFVNCILRNSASSALTVIHSNVKAVGCEIADAANGILRLRGGNSVFNHCTFANYYLFSAPGDAIICYSHLNADSDDASGLPYTTADFTNCIIYGNGADMSHGDLTGTNVMIRNCSLKSAGVDDANFIACLWECDPLYYTVRSEYIFDYRLKDESPAIGVGNLDLMLPEASIDFYGLPRGYNPDLGAYVYTPSEEQ